MRKLKSSIILFLSVLTMVSAFSQHKNELSGAQDSNVLRDSERYPWFQKTYDNYTLDTALISQLSALLNENVKITIIAGTWCGDTRRELPKIIKILDSTEFNKKNITLLFVSTRMASPGRPEKKFKVKRVPTFILYIDGKEKGRIIERPVTSLEQDLVNILSK